jgi:hypothetical protein
MPDPRVKFDWAARLVPVDAVCDALTAEGITVLEGHPTESQLQRSLVASKVAAAGVALDQDGCRATARPIAAQFTGTAPPDLLVRAIRRLVHGAHVGLVIDTCFPFVQIDDHAGIGRGVFALIEPRRVRLFNIAAEKALTAAISSANTQASAAA